MADYSFFENVYDVVRQVPWGRVTSYGAVASYLGAKRSSRMVGYAMQAAGAANPAVPAHRVVNRNGLLTGKFHFGGNTMQELLESEGIEIKADQVQNFKMLLWDPAIELAL